MSRDAEEGARGEVGDDLTATQRLALIQEGLEDGKAEDVVVIDLAGKSSIADFMIVASGRSNRHVVSICEKVIERVKQASGVAPRAEGMTNGDWVLIDASDVITHVFRPEVRAFYALEKMWGGASPTTADPAALRPTQDLATGPATDGGAGDAGSNG